MRIRVIQEDEPYRLITDGRGHYAVIEARDGYVYSIHPHHRHEALDTPAGMVCVVGDQWCDRDEALKQYQLMVRRETRYAEIIW
jgi:hypothetical protein